jgi:hypothetical protein
MLAGAPALRRAPASRPRLTGASARRRQRSGPSPYLRAIRRGFFNSPYVHFLRNALDYVPRKVDDDGLRELRWLYDRRDLTEARRDLAAWFAKWQATYPKLCGWVEEHIEETLTFYRLPRQHHKHLKSTNLLERLNEEIKRRWSASSPTPRAACGWSGRSRPRCTRTGWRRTAI